MTNLEAGASGIILTPFSLQTNRVDVIAHSLLSSMALQSKATMDLSFVLFV